MENKKTTDTIYKELLRQLKGLKDSKDYKSLLALQNTPELKSLLCRRLDIWKIHHSWDGIGKFINCFYGIPFEYYVVRRMQEVMEDDECLWKLVSWRGDKFESRLAFPESNSYADLLYEYISDKKSGGFKKGDRVAIECKWTEHGKGETLENAAKSRIISNFSKYTMNALRDGAVCFFQAIGVGWLPAKSEPEALYLLPVRKLTRSVNIVPYRVDGTLQLKKSGAVIPVDKEHKDCLNDCISHLTTLKKELGMVEKKDISK